MKITNHAEICPCCSDGRPICTDLRADGSRYSHEETCATYCWSDHLCAECESGDPQTAEKEVTG
jgi:hypothetical protein